MGARIDASVIVPTLGRVDRAAELSQYLGKLDPQPREVLFVFQILEELQAWKRKNHRPNVFGLFCPTVGQGAASNWAAAQSQSRYLVFLDDDCLPVDSAWLELITAPLSSPGVLLSTGAVLGWETASGSKAWMSKAFKLAPPFLTPWGNPASTKSSWCDSVAGGNFALKRSVFLQAKGFSEAFGSPCLYQETELALRITSRRRRTVWFSHDASVLHNQEPGGGHRFEVSMPSDDFLVGQKRLLLGSVYGGGLSSAMRLVLYRLVRLARLYILKIFGVSRTQNFSRG